MDKIYAQFWAPIPGGKPGAPVAKALKQATPAVAQKEEKKKKLSNKQKRKLKLAAELGLQDDAQATKALEAPKFVVVQKKKKKQQQKKKAGLNAHAAAWAPKKKEAAAVPVHATEAPAAPAKLDYRKCYLCFQSGHLKRDCPRNKTVQAPAQQKPMGWVPAPKGDAGTTLVDGKGWSLGLRLAAGRGGADNAQLKGGKRAAKKEKACFRCGETGHMKRDCTNKPLKKKTCYECGKPGHFASKCPNVETWAAARLGGTLSARTRAAMARNDARARAARVRAAAAAKKAAAAPKQQAQKKKKKKAVDLEAYFGDSTTTISGRVVVTAPSKPEAAPKKKAVEAEPAEEPVKRRSKHHRPEKAKRKAKKYDAAQLFAMGPNGMWSADASRRKSKHRKGGGDSGGKKKGKKG